MMAQLIRGWVGLMSNFREFDRATGFLLPPSLDEWLPERHLARFVVEVIDGLDLSAMVKSYRGSGSAGYHPALLLGLLVYGYTTGAFSSRKLERATYDSVAFRFIAANDHPDAAAAARTFGQAPDQRDCRFFGFSDRGQLAPGLRADVNLIDFDRLRLYQPELVHDMPAGGRRFVQRVEGYEATLVAGTPIFERGEHTGAMPGRLVRAGGKRRGLHA